MRRGRPLGDPVERFGPGARQLDVSTSPRHSRSRRSAVGSALRMDEHGQIVDTLADFYTTEPCLATAATSESFRPARNPHAVMPGGSGSCSSTLRGPVTRIGPSADTALADLLHPRAAYGRPAAPGAAKPRWVSSWEAREMVHRRAPTSKDPYAVRGCFPPWPRRGTYGATPGGAGVCAVDGTGRDGRGGRGRDASAAGGTGCGAGAVMVAEDDLLGSTWMTTGVAGCGVLTVYRTDRRPTLVTR